MVNVPEPDRATAHQALLRRARILDLTTSSMSDLRDISRKLALACEASRRAAIERILHPMPGNGSNQWEDANCGFAGLYAALRRVRAELKRRTARSSVATPAARDKQEQIPRQPKSGAQR